MKKVGSYALLISMLSGCSQQNTVNQTESEVRSHWLLQENACFAIKNISFATVIMNQTGK